MATLHFTGTDRKVFTPVSSALANLSNGAGTIVVLVKQTTAGGQDFMGLLDSAGTLFYATLGTDNGNLLWCDNGGFNQDSAQSNTTDWFLFAVDWPSGGAAGNMRFHYRDQTTLSSWTHVNASQGYSGNKAGPGTSGWLRLGYSNDFSTGARDHAVLAVWAGTRFADANYGLWSKTSDLYSHPLGPPTFLCELTATTLVDLIGASTYSSANSSGTALTGANPDNWTNDGIGGAVARPSLILPKSLGPRAVGPLFFAPLRTMPPDVVVAAPSTARRRRTMKGAGH